MPRTPARTTKEKTLSAKTVEQLQDIARLNEVEGYSELNRDDLVKLLMESRLDPATYVEAPAAQPTPDELHAEQMELERLRENLRRKFHS
jgi:hypothetical protein